MRGESRVAAEEFQFLVLDLAGAELVAEADEDGGLVSYDREAGGWLIVTTGAHWGPVHVQAAAYGTAPPLPGDEWEDVVELSVRCTTGLQVVDLGGTPRVRIVDRGGEYRLRVSASGRAAGRERYSSGLRSKVLERYSIEVWRAAWAAPRVLRETDIEPDGEAAAVEHMPAGRLAAMRICVDLRGRPGARALSGRRGSTRAEYEYRVTRRKLFRQFEDLYWLTGGGSRNGGLVVGNGYNCRGFTSSNPDRFEAILGDGGEIRSVYADFRAPQFITVDWNWFIPPASGSRYIPDLVAFLDPPAELRVDLAQRKDEDQRAVTTVTLEHSGLPVEWIDDMTDFWKWKLEVTDKEYNFNNL